MQAFSVVRKKTLFSLQYLRAIAATAVAVYHFRDIMKNYDTPAFLIKAFDNAFSGVDIFFVIAGFIILWTNRMEGSAVAFLAKRFWRIYSAFLPVAIAFLIVRYCFEGLFVNNIELDLIGSITLTNINLDQLLIYTSWSLTYELYFYSLFAIAIAVGRDSSIFFCIMVASIMLLISLIIGGALSDFLTSQLHFSFLIGFSVGFAMLSQRVSILSAVAGGCIGLLVFAIGLSSETQFAVDNRTILFGLSGGLIVLMCVRIEVEARMPFLRVFSTVGDASFAIYLLHVPIIYIMVYSGYFDIINQYFGWLGVLIVYVFMLIIFSIVFMRCVEIPLYKKGVEFLERRKRIGIIGGGET